MTQEETARRLGMSQPALANKIRLLRLSGEEQRIILENRLTERHARALLRVDDPIRRVQALKAIVERRLNVAQTEALIKDILSEAEPVQKPKRTFIAKDVRLFLNTIDHAVKAMKSAGIRAVSKSGRRTTTSSASCASRNPIRVRGKPIPLFISHNAGGLSAKPAVLLRCFT